MDAIHYKVKEDHQYVTKAAYVVLGIGMDGCKDILGVWVGEHKSSKFWLSVLNDLKSRGVLDVYLFCVDGLNRQFRRITKNKPSFTNDDSLAQNAVLGVEKDCRTLNVPVSKLGHQLNILFSDRPAG